MSDSRDIRALGTLLDKITERNQSFLDRCSEAKYLAVSNPTRATDVYLALVEQVLMSGKGNITLKGKCKSELEAVLSSMSAGNLSPELYDALIILRNVFLDDVLRPAVRDFLTTNKRDSTEVDSLYDSAVRIDGLIEVIRFLQRLNE